jgi:hypothetical protein
MIDLSYAAIKKTCNECLFAINPPWKLKLKDPMVDLSISVDKVLSMVGLELLRGNDHLFSSKQLDILRYTDKQLKEFGYIPDNEGK